MSDTNDQEAPGIGHNNPPDAHELFIAQLNEDTKDIKKRVAELAAAFARAPNPITTDDEARLCTDFAAQVKTALKAAEAKRKDSKGPLDKLAKAVQAHFAAIASMVEQPLAELERRIGSYQQAKLEAARKAAAEAERKAREEAEAKAAAARLAEQQALELARQNDAGATEKIMQAAQLSAEATAAAADATKAAAPISGKIAGNYGGAGHFRTQRGFVITDLSKLPRHLMMPDEQAIRAAIQEMSVEDIKSGAASIPGLQITVEEKFITKGAVA